MSIQDIADRIERETDEQAEVARMKKEFEADPNFQGYWNEYKTELPKRIASLDFDGFESLGAAIVYDFDAWKVDFDYMLSCGDDGAHGIVGVDVIKKRVFG